MENLITRNACHYFPFQPEIQCNSDYYIEQKPVRHIIKQHVALFYQFKVKQDGKSAVSIIPDGSFDILFCCSSRYPSVVLWTNPLHRRIQPNFKSECEYFGVRFLPEQSVIRLTYPMKELLDKQIPLHDVMSIDSCIAEKIGEIRSFAERIEAFEKTLERTMLEPTYNQRIVDYSIKEIYISRGVINIEQLASDIGYTARNLRKKFEEYIGFSPKQFSQIVKFQNSLGMILTINDFHLLDIVHKNGYYDQSHLIKAFKKFTHLSPTQFKEQISQNPVSL